MYLIEKSQLRVTKEYLKKKDYREKFSNCRFIFLQHLLPDTEELVYLIKETGADIHCILGKPFSYDIGVKERLEKFYRVEIHSYDHYDETLYLDELIEEAYNLSKIDKKNIIILEVGGYFSNSLVRIGSKFNKYLKGLVEVTTFGYNKYVKCIDKIKVPVYSVARSPIKSIEARYVGRAAVVAIDNLFRDIGVSIAGRKALVIGFGMIGKSVADTLVSNNVLVSIYDKKGFARLNAYTLGFHIGNKEDLLKEADIIFSATAEQAISYEDMERCKDKAILVSVGSRGNEFDVKALKENAIEEEEVHKNIFKYQINSNKTIYLVRNGTAVNFLIKSCPDEIVDLIHAEVISCAEILINDNKSRTKIGIINESNESMLHIISKDWLKNLI